ncbi:coproporphyrinogen III oxidase family protein [bacterium]|nr:coproporphyrinogen III oxidase family protein [bacterium]
MLRENPFDQGLGLYVHVPFCKKKCDYCSFYSKIPSNNDIELYLNRLSQEFRDRLTPELTSRIQTVFVGGGNPTALGRHGMKNLIDLLLTVSLKSPIREWTIESNPETLDPEVSKILFGIPHFRLSLGIQRLKNHELKILGRDTSMEKCMEALDRAFSITSRVSIDLIIGVPGCDSIVTDLSNLLARFPISHVSTYFLSAENGTPLMEKILRGKFGDPNDVGPEELFDVIDLLTSRNFEHYEISNFAISTRKCLHNLNYWRTGDYLGFGPSAVTTLRNARYSNSASLQTWLQNFIPGTEELSLEIRRKEFIMLGLRLLSEGLSLELFENRFGPISAKQKEILISQVSAGKISLKNSVYRLTRTGLPFANSIISELF